MAQHDFNIANQSFPSFRSDLNNALTAINTSQLGTSAPSSVAQGTLWIDSGTSGVLKLKLNDGTDNIELLQVNISTNAVSSSMSVTGTVTETDPQAAALAIALG
jgi:hypothetical protein|tara:strand:+ start:1101 stop:1412 length:312 start_codon:yes stop_codon:yes gene_type:complete